MKRKRVVLISILVVVLAMPIATSKVDTIAVSSTQMDTNDVAPIEKIENISPVDQAVISDSTQYVFDWEKFSGHGDIYDFVNAADSDSDYARLVEVDVDTTVLVAFSFQRTFLMTTGETFPHYLNYKLEVRGYEYSGVAGFSHENLKFYYRDSPLDSWIEIGTLSAQTATSYSWDIGAPEDGYFYLKVESPGTFGDSFSRNEWRLEYLRVACIDRYSYNVGVDVDKTFDGDNLYPYKGSVINDFYKFSCTAHNEEGGGFIDNMHLITKTEGGQYLWGVEWQENIWILDVWSNGVNLLEDECYISTSGMYQTAVFAVQLRYDCDDVSNMDFELYHESDTWDDTDLYDKDRSGRDLDQEPELEFRVGPNLPSRCDPGLSPTVTGALSFVSSISNVTPHFDHTYIHALRTEPEPVGEWSGGIQVDTVGNFAFDCLTKGEAGTTNVFRVRIYESSSLDDYTGLEGYAQTLCDEVVAYEYGVENNTLPLDTTTTIYTKLKYESDDAVITEGLVLWQTLYLTYNSATERWEAIPPVQHSPITISYHTLRVGTLEGVTQMDAQPSVSITWARLIVHLHIDAVSAATLVSTEYDPKSFVINVWLTDQNDDLVSGWINITMDGTDFAIYVDGTNYTTFYYSPELAGIYTIEANYAGDHYHDPAFQTMTGLTALTREISFDSNFPTDMAAETMTPFSFIQVYDDEYQGVFDGVTYIHNYPVNFKLKIWWTLDPEYGEPKNYVGYWNGTAGECTASWSLPWDLDGDMILTDDDFLCYIIVILDGIGVYSDLTFNIPIQVNHELELVLDIPVLTYSDVATISVEVKPTHDPTFSGDLDVYTNLFFSHDNETWILIETITTDELGTGTLDWECTECGYLYLKCETVPSWKFIQSVVYAECMTEKEGTYLTLIAVTSFTYSDQGILTAHLSTNDNDPLVNYPVYLEIYDDGWVSIGSGLTNESGSVNILWIPTLPEGQYSVRARAGLTDSLYYDNPEEEHNFLQVRKETLVISIDDTTINEGYLTAFVFDDEGNPLEGIPVSFFLVGSAEPLGIVITDSEGSSRLEASFQGNVVMRASVADTDYYYGISDEMTLAFPIDFVPLLVGAIGVLSTVLIAAFTRKFRRNRLETGSKPVPKEIRKELKKEHELIPKRRREETARKIAELDGDVMDASDS